MRTLQQAIERIDNKGGAGSSLRKHLNNAGIHEWKDINADSLFEFHDLMCAAIAPSTAKTITAHFKAILRRHKSIVNLPEDWEDILAVKGDVSRSIFLNPEELKAFESVKTKTAKEKITQIEFLIEAYTGARVSDVMELTEENFQGGMLTYTSKKTRVTATVPISEKTKRWIRYAQKHRDDEPSMAGREIIIKRIARSAGLTEMVKTRRGGVERVTPKWMVCTSHVARKSTATNLAMAGATLSDIKNILGHLSEATSSRYVVNYKPALSKEALTFFSN